MGCREDRREKVTLRYRVISRPYIHDLLLNPLHTWLLVIAADLLDFLAPREKAGKSAASQ